MDRAIERGRSASDASRWGDAWRALSTFDVDALDVDDLDRLGTAAYLIGHDEEGFSVWTRAHQRCVVDGSVHRAARFGVKLAQCLAFKGDLARSSGWVERIAHLLDDAQIDCVEQGYLEQSLAMARLLEHRDVAGARDLFARAGKTAARFGERELATLARIGEGRMEIYLGEIGHGIALLDEAAVSVEAGELGAIAAGDAYCTLIDASWEIADFGRCKAWTTTFTRWCDSQQELVLYRGHCFLHGADILREQGEWHAALAEAEAACARLAQPVNVSTLGGAHVLVGDVHRAFGHTTNAAAAYTQAHDLGTQPQPGLALLRLKQGRVAAAVAMIQRVLSETEDPISRSRLLPAAVEICLAAGDVSAASDDADELKLVASEVATPLLLARSARATGAVALARNDAARALGELRRAFTLCKDLGVHFETAVIRNLIAEACAALGDEESAEMERHAARVALASFSDKHAPVDDAPDGLTERETELLRLLAEGHTNRVIAQRLFISEKTVASHVSHIFTKTGVTSRAGATAYAYERGLM